MLILWDRDTTVLGLPLLPVALFAIWAGLIGVLAWASERGANRDGGKENGATYRAGSPAPSAND
jgi:hypothetical protein